MITSASIEANGWVLLVTVTGSLSAAGDFSGYTLDPNGTPRLVVTSSAPGFAAGSGAAVAATTARSLVATKPLRLPVAATAAGVRAPKTPDETSLGGGTIRVRIALSQHVYATDTGLTLTALAGWRTGEGAATIAVTNNSTLAAPSPIVRWADVPYQRLASTTLIPLEVVAFSHHPNGLAPVAGVRFTVTDGTNTATAWATALSSSPRYATGGTGVATRVYRVVVDGATATPAALTEGLIRCDFKAFPWIGQARSSNTLDTTLAVVASSTAPSMTGLGTAGMAPAAQVPFVYAYDPNNTWTPTLYVYVEPNTFTGMGTVTSNVLTVTSVANGALTVGTKISINAANFLSNLAAAGCTVVSQLSGTAGGVGTYQLTATPNVAAGAASTTGAVVGGGTYNNNILSFSSNPATAAAGVCAQAIDVARNGMVVQARTTAARNGQAAIGPKATDGIVIRIKAGTYANNGTAGVGSSIASTYSWDIIEGDPADANPRANVILNTSATTLRLNRVLIRNLFLNGPTSATSPFPTGYGWADNVEINGNSNFGNTAGIFGTATNTFWTNLKYWKINTILGGQLARNCQVENQITTITALNNARLPTAGVGTNGIGSPGSAVDPLGATQDIVAAGNDLRYISSARAWACTTTAAASAGATALGTTGYAVFNRQVFANNVCETYGTSNPMFNAIGENGATVATYSIVEGNTVVGDRTNWLYDDLNLATVAANDAESNIMLVNRVANNVFDQHSIKHDSFNDPTVAAQRIGVALAPTRSKAFAVGAEIVIAGSQANVYRCITAGTTAASGGPTGTGADITDGTVHWAWFATEARQHGYRPNAVRGWSALYGVGMLDNVILRGNPDPEFLHEFEGLNTPNFSVDTGVAADPKFTLDKSGTANAGTRYDPANTGGGNYKPLAASPLVARARAANIDIDQSGAARPALFASGALQNNAGVALTPAATAQTTRASSPIAALAIRVSPAAAAMATRAVPAGVGWTTTVRAASTASATRAAASLTGWTTTLKAVSGSLATRAKSGLAAWTTALLPDTARSATAAGTGRVDWQVLLAAASARAATAATAGAIDQILPGALAPDSGRMPVVDRTLPTLLPGSVTPPERTLIVTGDFRALIVPAD